MSLWLSLFTTIMLCFHIIEVIAYEPSIQYIIDCNTNGILGSSDTCYINCNEDDPGVQYVYCATAGKCIIDCNERKCLYGAKIYANDQSGPYLFTVNVTAHQCLMDSELYLPFEGDAIIIVNNYGIKGQNDLFKDSIVHGEYAENVFISCIDPSGIEKDPKDECTGLQIEGKNVQYLEINIDKAEMNEAALVECPENSNHDGVSCIINATTATDLDIDIVAIQGSPQDVLYYGNTAVDDQSTLKCSAGSDVTVNNVGTFEETICWITESPTSIPTASPTIIQPTIGPISSNEQSMIPNKYTTTTTEAILSNEPSMSPSTFSATTHSNTQLHTKLSVAPTIITGPSNSQSANAGDSSNFSTIIVVVALSVAVLCLCACIIMGYFRFKRYKKRRDSEIREIKSEFEMIKFGKKKKRSTVSSNGNHPRSNSTITQASRAEGDDLHRVQYIAGKQSDDEADESEDNIITSDGNGNNAKYSFIVMDDDEQETMGNQPIMYRDQLIERRVNMDNNAMYMKQKKGPRMDDFSQVIGDDVMANQIAMDDIVDEMEGVNDNDILLGHKTTE